MGRPKWVTQRLPPPVDPDMPYAWIIERKGFRPVFCWTKLDAKHAAKNEDTRVTPYFSEWDPDEFEDLE